MVGEFGVGGPRRRGAGLLLGLWPSFSYKTTPAHTVLLPPSAHSFLLPLLPSIPSPPPPPPFAANHHFRRRQNYAGDGLSCVLLQRVRVRLPAPFSRLLLPLRKAAQPQQRHLHVQVDFEFLSTILPSMDGFRISNFSY